MAIDLSALGFFNMVWPFLLTFTIVYAALGMVQTFKDQKAIRAAIAFVLAILTLLYPVAWKTINTAAPWFVLLIFLIIFMLVAFQALGISHESIVKMLTTTEYGVTINYWVLFLVLIILIGSLSYVISEEKKFTSLREGETATNITTEDKQLEETSGFFATITHPKVLGMALILLIAFFTISNLSEK
jgi:hypothetical protein